MLDNLLQGTPVWAFLMISVFELIGGMAIGFVIGQLIRQFSLKGLISKIFLLIWGAGFALIPLVIGATMSPAVLIVQLLVLAAAILIPVLAYNSLVETFRSPSSSKIAFGGLFTLIGLIGGTVFLRQGRSTILAGLLFGGLFMLVGIPIMIQGLRALSDSGTGAEDEEALAE